MAPYEEGWCCPLCSHVWAPHVDECSECNAVAFEDAMGGMAEHLKVAVVYGYSTTAGAGKHTDWTKLYGSPMTTDLTDVSSVTVSSVPTGPTRWVSNATTSVINSGATSIFKLDNVS